MSAIITRLQPPNKFSNVSGKNFTFDLHWKDLKKSSHKAIQDTVKKVFQKKVQETGIKPELVANINKEGFFDAGKQLIAVMPPEDWNQIRRALIKGKAKDPVIPDPKLVDIPEPPIRKEGRFDLTFRMMDEPHYLDKIEYPHETRLEGETDAQFIRRIAKNLAGEEYDPNESKTRDSLNGIAESIVSRKNYEAKTKLRKGMREFFKKNRLISREIFAKNGFIPGSVASSFNRFAKTPTLLRAVAAEDGSIDLVSGRAFDLPSAQTVASFAFLSQMNLYNDTTKAHLAMGISKNGDLYEFEFSPQSFLPTAIYIWSEMKMNEKLVKAYRDLSKEIVEVTDPETKEVYRVRFKPHPPSSIQYNWQNTLEKILPSSFSGEYLAKDASKQARKKLHEKMDTLTEVEKQTAADRMGILPNLYEQYLLDTRYFLEKLDNQSFWESSSLTPTEELLCHNFYCHLLGVPVIDNCKSVVDRTNIGNANITSMKQWLRTSAPIPKREGRFAIFDLPKVEHEKYHPYKELFAANLHKGIKITEYSRGVKGYKLGRGWAQHPALWELMPRRYLKIKNESRSIYFYKRWVVPVLFWVLPPFLWQLFALIGASQKERNKVLMPQLKFWKKRQIVKAVGVSLALLFPFQYLAWFVIFGHSLGHSLWNRRLHRILGAFFFPFKFIAHADALLPKKHINETYRKAGERRLLIQRKEIDPIQFEDSDS